MMTTWWIILAIIGVAAVVSIRDFRNPSLLLILGFALLFGLLPAIGAIAIAVIVVLALVALIGCLAGEPLPWT